MLELALIAAVLAQPHRITVRDARTHRGVPMVELTSVNSATWITDSAGVIAFDEPGLMDRSVYFTIRSHGYTFPKDGFGFAGRAIRTGRGGETNIPIDRVNIAERLYRITGQGIYRDSVMLGDESPIREPLLAGGVLGQDSVQAALYRGRVLWIWGDTNRAAYPLGNFSASGATSLLPSRGGLEPAVGIDLIYFVGEDGFSRPMCPIEGQPGPVWLDGLVTVPDADGREVLLCRFARMKSLGEMHEMGIARYNDETDRFEPMKRVQTDTPLFMRGQPVRHTDESGAYWYFATPFALLRCRADLDSLLDPDRYEGFTCLKPGTHFDPENPALDRDPQGRLVYSWKPGTPPIFQKEQKDLIARGLMKPEEALIRLTDSQGNDVLAHAGSTHWNAHRRAWVMIFQELWGTSLCGETWYTESPSLTGPWSPAVKVVTHDDYSFYNVAHHPFFDEDGGRVIYFQGTYTMAFSGTKVPTPRYDYNQIMYRLNLADLRLHPDK